MSSQCSCCQNYHVTHKMNWKKGDYVIMKHHVRNFEANLLKTTLNDLEIEPNYKKLIMKG